MPVGHVRDREYQVMEGEGIEKVVKKALIGQEEGWDDHVMRLFEVGPGGHTPLHTHRWPHINYMVEGKGVLHIDGTDHPVEPGSFAFVPEGSKHQFRNVGEGTFAFLCIVPKRGDF